MDSSISRTLEEIPISDMVGSIALSLMKAQHALDLMSLRTAEMMSGRYNVRSANASGEEVVEAREAYVELDGERLSLLELGFTPTFYQFAEARLEVKLSFSMSHEASDERSSSASSSESHSHTEREGFLGSGGSTTTTTAWAASVDARFASRFQYSASGSSVLSTRLVPVPAPALLMEKAQALVEENRSAP